MKFFDSHAHYNDEKFENNRDELITRMYNDDTYGIICAGYNLESSNLAINIANKYESMWATCGISPNDIPKNVDNINSDMDKIEKIAQNKKIVAIGEIGLDYYWNKENKDIQKEYFIKQIDIANKLELPIVIHSRDAIYDTIEILKEYNVIRKGVFHCCQLNEELVKQALKLNFYISFAGAITFKNAKNANTVIKSVPMNKILIETDSPYLSPEPFRGKINTSSNLKYIAEKIANVKEIDIKKVMEATIENTKRIFKL